MTNTESPARTITDLRALRAETIDAIDAATDRINAMSDEASTRDERSFRHALAVKLVGLDRELSIIGPDANKGLCYCTVGNHYFSCTSESSDCGRH